MSSKPKSNPNGWKTHVLIGSSVFVCLTSIGIAFYSWKRSEAYRAVAQMERTKADVFQEQARMFAPSNDTQTTIPPSPSATSIFPTPIATTSKAQLTQPPKLPQANTLPAGWQSFTAEDGDLGIKTQLAVPPGFLFYFTGSEFSVYNDATQEIWSYEVPAYSTKDGELAKYYDGSSRRAWYQGYLAKHWPTAKVTSIKEHSLPNGSTYLEYTFDAGGAPITHYLYVQNGMLHVLAPASDYALSKKSALRTWIGNIFNTLTSQRTK